MGLATTLNLGFNACAGKFEITDVIVAVRTISVYAKPCVTATVTENVGALRSISQQGPDQTRSGIAIRMASLEKTKMPLDANGR